MHTERITRGATVVPNDVLDVAREAALAAGEHGVPYLVVRGRMGGSAMTAAAVNALAKEGI